jgi:2-polyprenyl-6-methoxyphenol hydroxylase-like FAD-dependent oxidoreductase
LFENKPEIMTISVQCCIVGGGPDGMMLGWLLARAGIDVAVLEKHADIIRNFRGDTIHPSTLELMSELGVLEEFLKLPHQEVRTLRGQVGDVSLPVADFNPLPTRCKFLALMPQWDFLNFLAGPAARHSSLHLTMQAEVNGLIEASGRVVGVRSMTPTGPLEVRAALVVAADGRHSVVREKASPRIPELGAPMDVLWFRLSRRPEDPEETVGRFDVGRIFIMINCGEHWQCGYVIPIGSIEKIRHRGLGAFREGVAKVAPFAANRVEELCDWEQVKLLTVRVDRLPQWYRPGLLCVGDAAHAMSPIGGVGINLAVQDAVAATNLLAESLRGGATHYEPPAQGATATRVAHADHPAGPGSDPATGDHPGAGRHRPAGASTAASIACVLSLSPPAARSTHRDRHPPRACGDARRAGRFSRLAGRLERGLRSGDSP